MEIESLSLFFTEIYDLKSSREYDSDSIFLIKLDNKFFTLFSAPLKDLLFLIIGFGLNFSYF